MDSLKSTNLLYLHILNREMNQASNRAGEPSPAYKLMHEDLSLCSLCLTPPRSPLPQSALRCNAVVNFYNKTNITNAIIRILIKQKKDFIKTRWLCEGHSIFA